MLRYILQKKRGKFLSLVLVLTLFTTLAPDQTAEAQVGAFVERAGILVIEAESASSIPNDWVVVPGETPSLSDTIDDPGAATGGGYIVWEGSQQLSNPGTAIINYPIKINNPGVYDFKWRNQVGLGTQSTEHNDTWLKIEADSFFAEKGDSILCPKGYNQAENDCTGSEPNGAGGSGWFKVYTGSDSGLVWNYTSLTSDFDGHVIEARFDNPGIYNIQISARSSGHVLDRLVLVRQNLFPFDEEDTSLPESPRVLNTTDVTPPDITRLGDNPITVQIGQPFVDPGATATDAEDGNLTDDIVVFGNVDTNTAGTYRLIYTVVDGGGNSDRISRNVEVVDPGTPDPPVITAITDDTGESNSDFITNDTTLTVTGTALANGEVELFVGGNSQGTTTASGAGNFTFDLTGVTLSDATYNLTATVTNTATNNTSQLSDVTSVIVDTTAPTLTLNGDSQVSLNVGDTYNEPGATATNTTPGDLDSAIVIGGDTVDTNTAGTYTITYNVSDPAGNAASQLQRVVTVSEVTAVCNDLMVKIPLNNSNVMITPDDIDGGSTASSGIASRTVAPDTFGAADIGQTTSVTLTVTDNNSDTATCTGDVTVTSVIDVNGDLAVTPADAVFIVNRIGMQNPTSEDLAADVNGDNQITEADLQSVLDNLGVSG